MPRGGGMTPGRWIMVVLLLLVVAAVTVYVVDIGNAYRRVAGRSSIVESPYGDIEFIQGGSGPAVLVVHGSGGGYDQGELVAQAVLGDRFHWIAPSRFGYLRSTFRDGATFDDQADAYVHLLDHLRVDKVAVVALSHGGPSALLFAARYPERVSSLILLSCGVASSTGREQAQANRQGAALLTIFRHDPLYWGVSKLFRQQLMKLMGATEPVIAGLSRGQRELVDQVIDFMNPVSQRSAGTVFDNRAAMPNERIAAIRAPTLIFHATDDTLQLYRNAQYAAAHIPGARLQRFERGGHLVIAVEQESIRAAAHAFIQAHAVR
jgi:pimeloyl-ACP methyl ester carboxylesterase